MYICIYVYIYIYIYIYIHSVKKSTPPSIIFKAIFVIFCAKTTRPATRNSRRAKLVSDKDGCGHAKGR